ncbi:MAG: hypothetical protein K9H49_19600 [Bacteroidales bacterium]|nr:hypothetical protein [Bacteroidales bacterium]MCF8391972.1 hypothetical protein [Bacteroidales bacterium]
MKLNRLIHIPLIIVFFSLNLFIGCNTSPSDFLESDQTLEIYPDYTEIIVPPNIAPMNFRIENEGDKFKVELSNTKAGKISIRTSSGVVEIPLKKWRKLLNEDKGGRFSISVFKKNKGEKWMKLKPVSNEISRDEISSYIAFRKIPASYILWNEMGIYQRSVENFEETPIMVNAVTDKNCMNCHSFNAGDPNQFLFHMRTKFGGTIILNDDSLSFLDTKNEYTRSAGVYPSWHPDGNLVAFSVNQIRQKFHSKKGNLIYVFDQYSDIVLFDIGKNTTTRPIELASDNLENLPTWSVDGNNLYYICSDPYIDTLPYNTKKYNLMTIPFEKESRKFGQADTLLNAADFGKSITFPRESPQKNIIAFIGADYGYFSIYNPEADVYFYNTETRQVSKPEINSDFTESYPSWSTNGSWLMFISKRKDGVLSQVWFSHVDENGRAGKPFVLPQKDPDFYESQLYNFNRPEFISEKVNLNPRKILSRVKKGTKSTGINEQGSVSATSGATATANPLKDEGEIYQHN